MYCNIRAKGTVVVRSNLTGSIVADVSEHGGRNYLASHGLEFISEIVQSNPIKKRMRLIELSFPGYIEIRALIGWCEEFVNN